MRHLITSAITVVVLSGCMSNASTAAAPKPSIVGGYNSVSTTNAGVIAAANFAVSNEQQTLTQILQHPLTIKLVSINEATQQVVAGMNYEMKLTVSIDGAEREAVVLVYQGLGDQAKMELMSWDTR